MSDLPNIKITKLSLTPLANNEVQQGTPWGHGLVVVFLTCSSESLSVLYCWSSVRRKESFNDGDNTPQITAKENSFLSSYNIRWVKRECRLTENSPVTEWHWTIRSQTTQASSQSMLLSLFFVQFALKRHEESGHWINHRSIYTEHKLQSRSPAQ